MFDTVRGLSLKLKKEKVVSSVTNTSNIMSLASYFNITDHKFSNLEKKAYTKLYLGKILLKSEWDNLFNIKGDR